VRTALDVGYRHIDTAACYGNEEQIGETLSAYMAEKGVKREELFIVTKLWLTHNREAEVEPALRESLKKLRLDYVDLYLVHMPVPFKADNSGLDMDTTVLDTWRGMEHVYDIGLAKAVGVSNFSTEQIERIMSASPRVPIHNHQVELHLSFPQWEMQKICDKWNVSLCAYGPIGSPGRVNFQPTDGRAKLVWVEGPEPLKNPVVVGLAEKYHKTPAQVLLRHLIQRNIVVIPKSTNPKRIEENFQVFDFELSTEELAELNKQPVGPRLFDQGFLAGHPEDPFAAERTGGK